MDDPAWPRDEYDCLVGPVLRHLEAGDAPEVIVAFLTSELKTTGTETAALGSRPTLKHPVRLSRVLRPLRLVEKGFAAALSKLGAGVSGASGKGAAELTVAPDERDIYGSHHVLSLPVVRAG
jgi:hypothetical protein